MREILAAFGLPPSVTATREGDSLKTTAWLLHDHAFTYDEHGSSAYPSWVENEFGDRLAVFIPKYLNQKSEQAADRQIKRQLWPAWLSSVTGVAALFVSILALVVAWLSLCPASGGLGETMLG